MGNQVRIEIESRRFVMQLLISIKEFVIREIDPYLELLNHLTKKRISYRVVEIVGVLPEWGSYLKVLFSKSPYKSHSFLKSQFEFEKTHSLLAEFYNQFPSTQVLKYIPNVSQVSSLSSKQNTLRHIITTLQLVDRKTYVYYFRYGVIVEISLYQILKADCDILFNTWREDVVIFPSSFEWVITYTGSNTWYAGYKKFSKTNN